LCRQGNLAVLFWGGGAGGDAGAGLGGEKGTGYFIVKK